MSTILKALQKIEHERDQRSGTEQRIDPLPLPSLYPGGATNPSSGRRFRPIWVWGVFACLAVAVAGMVALGYGWFSASSDTAEGAVAGSLPASAAPVPDQPVQPVQERGGHRASAAMARSLPAETQTVEKIEPVVPEPSPNRPVADSRHRTPAPDADIAPEIKPYFGDRLTVQAIVWGPLAPQRMAVINNRVVHIGEGVDGWVVVDIITDAVIVRQGQAHWRVSLGR